MQWKRTGAQRYLTEVKPAGRGNPQVCDIEPLDQVTMEIVLRRKKKNPAAQAHPRHPEENCWGRQARARDRARRLSRPGSLFLPSSAGPRLPAPRRRRRRRAARGPSEPSAARCRERERERARSRQPAWAPSGAVSQPRSWNLKRQTPLGVWGQCPREEHAGRPRSSPGRDGQSRPGEKSFLRGRRRERVKTCFGLLSGMQNTGCKE